MSQAFNEMRWHNPTGQWYVRMNGGRKYLGTSEEKARVLYEELKREFLLKLAAAESRQEDPETPQEFSSKTIAGLVTQYVMHLRQKDFDSSTWRRINPALELLVKHFGKVGPSEFLAKSFRFLRDRIVELKRQTDGEPISRKWANHLSNEIRYFVRWAGEEELIPSETVASILMIKPFRLGQGGRETEIRLPPEPGVVEDTLEYLFAPVRDMVQLQLLTGIRPGELCELKPAYFSKSPSEQIQIPNTRKKVSAIYVDRVLVWLYGPPHHKTQKRGKHRVIPIGPKGQEILKPFLEGRPPFAYIFDPRITDRKFPGGIKTKANSMTPDSYWLAIRNALRRANRSRSRETPPRDPIPHWHPYLIRHQAATDIGDQYDAEHAAAILGHSGMDTIDTYMRQQIGKASKVAAERG